MKTCAPLLDVIPIAITKVDWTIFNRTVEDWLGYRPSKGLDESNISLERLSAFPATLDFKNQPLECLRNNQRVLEAVQIVFIVCTDDELALLELIEQHQLQFINVNVTKGRETFSIVHGNLAYWRNIALTSSLFGNKVHQLLCKMSFDELFYYYRKVENADGTYYLKRKS